MQEITDDILSGYLDRELDQAQQAEVEAEIARNPALARRLAALREADALTREAFSGIGAQDIPEPLLNTVADSASAPRRPAWPRPRVPSFLRPMSPMPAMTMGLVAGVVLSLAIQLPNVLGNTDSGSYAKMASRPTYPMQPVSPLTKVLATKPSGAMYSPGKLSVVVLKTFRSETGRVCREYKVHSQGSGSSLAMAGIACRTDDSDWSNEIMVSLNGPGPNQYMPAASGGLKSRRAIWRNSQVLPPKKEQALLQRWDTQTF